MTPAEWITRPPLIFSLLVSALIWLNARMHDSCLWSQTDDTWEHSVSLLLYPGGQDSSTQRMRVFWGGREAQRLSLEGSEVMDLLECLTKTPNNREMHCIKPGGQEGFKKRSPLGLFSLASLHPGPAGKQASSHKHSGMMRGWDRGALQ